MTIVFNGKHTFGFELDENKKLIDIQPGEQAASESAPTAAAVPVPTVVDPLRLLCDSALLPAPLDLRHALLATSSALRRDLALQTHLASLHKLCLLQRDPRDPCKMDVAFRNGISASLRVHDCYPDVSMQQLSLPHTVTP